MTHHTLGISLHRYPLVLMRHVPDYLRMDRSRLNGTLHMFFEPSFIVQPASIVLGGTVGSDAAVPRDARGERPSLIDARDGFVKVDNRRKGEKCSKEDLGASGSMGMRPHCTGKW